MNSEKNIKNNAVFLHISENKNRFYYLIWLYDTLKTLQLGLGKNQVDLSIDFDSLALHIVNSVDTSHKRKMMLQLQKCEECYEKLNRSLIQVCFLPEVPNTPSLSLLIEEWQKDKPDHKVILENIDKSSEELNNDLSDSLENIDDTIDETDLLILYMFYYQYKEFLEKNGLEKELSLLNLLIESKKNIGESSENKEIFEESSMDISEDKNGEIFNVREWAPLLVLLFIFGLVVVILISHNSQKNKIVIDKTLNKKYEFVGPPVPQIILPLVKKPVKNIEEKKIKKGIFDDMVKSFPSTVHPKKNFWKTEYGFNLLSVINYDETLKKYFVRHHGLVSKKNENKVRRYLNKNYPKIKFSKDLSWCVVDMQTGSMIGWQIDKGFEGASVVKIWPMASLFDKMKGWPTMEQMAQIIPMIAVSSNSAWTKVIYFNARVKSNENITNKSRGMRGYYRIQRFLKRNDYNNTKGGRSSIGAGESLINTRDLGKYFYDINHKKLIGSEAEMKILTICRTAGKKGYRYTPGYIYGGGKTGTFSFLAHDVRFYEINGLRYAICVLTKMHKDPDFTKSPSGSNDFRNETVAILHGGLMREYILGTMKEITPGKKVRKKFYSGSYKSKKIISNSSKNSL